MDELVSQLAIERPEDPIRFIVNWIDKTGGYTTEGLNEQEKKEMEKLKEELKQLRSQS